MTVNESYNTNAWLFFPDRPVKLRHGNILWTQEDDIVWQQIEDIARRLIEPVASNFSSDSITFAIHGEWGAGKSSFQGMIRDRTEELEKELLGDCRSRIKFCEYIASSYINLDVDVRTTLAMQVLTALANDDRSKALECFEATSFKTEKEQLSTPDPRSIQLNVDLQSLATYLSRLVDFPSLLSKELEGRGQIKPFGEGIPGILVVLIDDLDRCPLETVTEILSITQQWGKVRNLFFILAINQNVLLEAIRERAPEKVISDPDYALEKYVQHTVTVPSLDSNRLRSYVQNLLQEYYEHDEVSKAISDNVEYLELGLRYRTPRAVKRCLNTIRPDIRAQISSNQDPKKAIKERVLQYSWREFYSKFFIPSVKSNAARPVFQKAWEDLESACRAYIQDASYRQDFDDEKLDFLIKRVKTYYRDLSFPEFLDRDLVRYLAHPPYWLLNIADEANLKKDSASRIPGLVDESLLRTVSVNLDNEFKRLYNANRVAIEREQPDVKTAMQYALEAAQIVQENFDVIPGHRADEVGNLAFSAESFGFIPFADALFQLALRLKPNHPNNMRGYVSFIADAQLGERYDIALNLLHQLERDFPDFRPDLVRGLKAQMARLTGNQISIPEDQLQQLLTQVEEHPTDKQLWATSMSFASHLSDYDLLIKLTEKTLRPEFISSFSLSDVYTRLRGLADSLSQLEQPMEARREALEIYSRFLSKSEIVESDHIPDILHNYAVGLYRYDYDDEAGKLWYEAYKIRPNDSRIRNAYSSYLIRAKRGDLAERIQEGKPISEMVLQPVHQVMPAQFSNADYIDRFFSLFDQIAVKSLDVDFEVEDLDLNQEVEEE